MSESKPHQFKPPLYHDETASGGSSAKPAAIAPARANERKGWEAYRKWLSTVSGRPASERAPLDNSIYSWKGYHTWADRVKQSWKPEDD
jgi:hypothetical protein